jgi:hypothetical protein
MNERKFLTEQVYDFLMENSYTRLDFVKNFPDSWMDYGNPAIYLMGSDGLKSYKLTLEEIQNEH